MIKLTNSYNQWSVLTIAILLFGFSFAVQAQDYQRIRNKQTSEYINTESGKLQSTEIKSGWLSAQWLIENAGGGYVRIKNRWTEGYLHIENGQLECGTIENGWWSAQWKLVKTHNANFKQITNKWKSNEGLYTQNSSLICGDIKGILESALWEISPISDALVIKKEIEEEVEKDKQVEVKPVVRVGGYVPLTATINNESDWQAGCRFTYGDGSKSQWYYINTKSDRIVMTESKEIVDLELQWKDVLKWKKIKSYAKAIRNYPYKEESSNRVKEAESNFSITIKGGIAPRNPIQIVE